jgi:hypothetical protein
MPLGNAFERVVNDAATRIAVGGNSGADFYVHVASFMLHFAIFLLSEPMGEISNELAQTCL